MTIAYTNPDIDAPPIGSSGAWLVIHIAQAHIERLCNDWAAVASKRGKYDPQAHAILAAMALEARELEQAAETAEKRSERLFFQAIRQGVVSELLVLMGGLERGEKIETLLSGGEV